MGGNLCGGGCVTKEEKEEWRGNEGKNGGRPPKEMGSQKKLGQPPPCVGAR